ncbi:MAG: PBP1A family penicillin-binding protein [Chloroflexi bacterium]|nr:PBP1A family penicillin-binding protein [Chloroflexota bacterium]
MVSERSQSGLQKSERATRRVGRSHGDSRKPRKHRKPILAGAPVRLRLQANTAKTGAAPAQARVALPAITFAPKHTLTKAVPAAYSSKKRQRGRNALFLLGTARRRRARGGASRGGYYALSTVSKQHSLPRPVSWALRSIGSLVLASFLLSLFVGIGLLIAYAYFAKDLPSVDNIHGIQFQTTRIYDRHGNLLYEMYDPDIGKRTYATIDQLPKSLINATIAVEDSTFEQNNGVDLRAIIRAFYINLTNKGSSGASTITQQLVRRVLLPEKDEKTFTRKIREAILAVRVNDKYSKEKILEIYLNEIYYGSQSYGVAAAAETYFGKSVKDLTLGESAMLAGLPQSPSDYDLNRNFEAARARQKVVLDLMVSGKFVSRQEADTAYAEDVHPIVRTAHVPLNAPHFVRYVQQALEAKYGEEMANRGGLKVFTTIDLDMQAAAQSAAAQQIENIKKQGASNAALVAVNPRTGEILAMVGSVDYTDPRFGEVNVATALRQPGSSFKPFTYATAMQMGYYNPDSILSDLPVQFSSGAGLPPYVPQNYDMRFHGPVTMRSALGNSYNIPAVETLNTVGVANVLDTAHRMGITTLNDPSRYGLALTLGGGEVTLLDMTSAFGTFANYGYHVPVTPFLKIIDSQGRVLEELDPSNVEGNQAISKGVAYQMSDMLSDNAARTPAFGPNSPLKIDGINAAVKTGTTNDWKDSWTVGYTPALAVGVWVGNNDNRPMAHVAGAIGAAPIWHNFIQKVYSDPKLKALLYKPNETALPDKFVMPSGMVKVTVCADSGMVATSACLQVKDDWFAPEDAPTKPDTWHRWVPVTLHDGGASVAGPGVPLQDTIERSYTFPPPEYKGWIGGGPPGVTFVMTPTVPSVALLPTAVAVEPTSVAALITPVAYAQGDANSGLAGLSQPDNSGPITGLQLGISSPVNGQVVSGLVPVTGEASAANFARFILEYSSATAGAAMTPINDSLFPPLLGTLGLWNTDGLPSGPYILRLSLETTDGEVVRKDVNVRIGTSAPSVSIASPVDGSPVYEGEAVDINVSADGGGAPIAGVEVYVDNKRIASLLAPPWSARWAVITGTHELRATLYTLPGEEAQSMPVRITSMGTRPTPTSTPAPIMWISSPTLNKELKAGINEVWVDVQPDSQVRYVNIYIDGYPGGYATGPGFRVNPNWTPTPTEAPTQPPTPTLDANAAATATRVEATTEARSTSVAGVIATRTARAAAAQAAKTAHAAATAASANATATVVAATTSPTPAPPTETPLPSVTPTFVRQEPLPDPMLGDYVARCQLTPGRHRITAIGYDANNREVDRDETWVVVK